MELQTIQTLVLQSLEEFNLQVEDGQQLEISPETILFGKSGKLDSFGLVNLIVVVEEKIIDTFRIPVSLADERAISQENSPFRTANTLAEYILILLNEADGNK
jgi:acyl carrier protein